MKNKIWIILLTLIPISIISKLDIKNIPLPFIVLFSIVCITILFWDVKKKIGKGNRIERLLKISIPISIALFVGTGIIVTFIQDTYPQFFIQNRTLVFIFMGLAAGNLIFFAFANAIFKFRKSNDTE